MGLWEISIFLLVLITVLFVVFCASPEGNNPLSMLNRVLFIYFPRASNRVLSRVLGERNSELLKHYVFYIFYEPNYFFPLVYLTLSIGGYLIFMNSGFPMIPNQYISETHIYIGSCLYIISLVLFLSACMAPPGIITKENYRSHLELFPYDNIIHKPADCRTCKMQKPARSKHCSICKVCVSKHDHHCIWLNQCVGYSNYKYFLLFILSTSAVCSYAGTVGCLNFLDFIKKNELLTATFTDSLGNEFEANWTLIFQYLLQQFSYFVFVVVLCVLMGFVLGGFFIYHFIMAADNSTTTERIKQLRLQDDYKNIYDKGFLNNLKEVLEAGEF